MFYAMSGSAPEMQTNSNSRVYSVDVELHVIVSSISASILADFAKIPVMLQSSFDGKLA